MLRFQTLAAGQGAIDIRLDPLFGQVLLFDKTTISTSAAVKLLGMFGIKRENPQSVVNGLRAVHGSAPFVAVSGL